MKHTAAVPQPPEWLCEDAKAEWLRVIALPAAKAADPVMLAAYCQCYGRWREAERFLEENGTILTVRDDKGVVKSIGKAPQVDVSSRNLDRMVKLGKALGIGGTETAEKSKAPGRKSAPVVDESSEWFGEIKSSDLM